MNVGMTKIKEDKTCVSYILNATIAGETYLVNGKQRRKLVEVQGYCTFNKQTGVFELDKDKTDSYFFTSREIQAIRARLLRLSKEHHEFPEQMGITTG